MSQGARCVMLRCPGTEEDHCVVTAVRGRPRHVLVTSLTHHALKETEPERKREVNVRTEQGWIRYRATIETQSERPMA